MKRTITRLFNSHAEALRAVEDLERSNIAQADINLIANNSERWDEPRSFVAAEPHAHENHTAQDAGTGAVAGGILGGGAGLLAGLGLLAMPGMGPVLAAGFLTTAIAGLAAGAVTGGMIGALRDAGESEEDAQTYAEGVRRGGSLVSVRVAQADVELASEILARHGGVDATTRAIDYRRDGWSRFDAQAPAYSAEQIAAERARYSQNP